MKVGLTPQMARCLAFLKERIATTGVCPSMREISTHLGCNSSGAAHRMLNHLQRRGHITRTPGASRSIRIIETPNPVDAARDALARVGAAPTPDNITRIAQALVEARSAA